MKLVACVRQKNGLKYLPRLIPQLQKIADVVIFLDDHSTDGSYEYLLHVQFTELPKGTFFVIDNEEDFSFNGGRDWNQLYKFAEQFKPDFLFCPDVDELIEEGSEASVRKLAESSGRDILGWSFPFYYLWDDEQHYRDDGPYFNTRVIRLFRYDPTNTPPTRATHSTAVPDSLDRRRIRVADIRMWHFGYMDKAERKAKYDHYKERDKDPLNAGAGSNSYEHMISCNSGLPPQVPSLADWAQAATGEANFLQRKPYRVAIGSPFPTAIDAALDTLPSTNFSNDSIDELRISYLFDGLTPMDSTYYLQHALRTLRPGGRLETIVVDFEAMCDVFAKASTDQKYELAQRLIQTPHRQPFLTAFFEDRLYALLTEIGFEDVQRVPLVEFPARLYMIAYKPGPVKWI